MSETWPDAIRVKIRNGFLPLRSLAMGINTLLWSVPVILVTPLGRKVQDQFVTWWARSCLWLGGIRFRVVGMENLPAEGALLVFNHSSLLDIPALHSAVAKSFRFGAKKELFRIPIFGLSMRMAGALEIPRQNLSKAIQVYDRAVGRIQSGESFALSPEGTRTAGREIGPFKTGPFVLAIKAQAPVIPVVIWGARELMGPKQLLINPLENFEITVAVLPPVSSVGYQLDERDRLRDIVHSVMVQRFLAGP